MEKTGGSRWVQEVKGLRGSWKTSGNKMELDTPYTAEIAPSLLLGEQVGSVLDIAILGVAILASVAELIFRDSCEGDGPSRDYILCSGGAQFFRPWVLITWVIN